MKMAAAAGVKQGEVPPGDWVAYTATLAGRPGRKLRALEVRMHVSNQATIEWHLPVFAGAL